MPKGNKENNPLPAFCDRQQLRSKCTTNVSHSAFLNAAPKNKVHLCKSAEKLFALKNNTNATEGSSANKQCEHCISSNVGTKVEPLNSINMQMQTITNNINANENLKQPKNRKK
jgi:hypothetical protein